MFDIPSVREAVVQALNTLLQLFIQYGLLNWKSTGFDSYKTFLVLVSLFMTNSNVS